MRKCCPGLLFTRLAQELLGTAQPYLVLYLSGRMVSELLAARPHSAWHYALLCVVSAGILQCLTAFLHAVSGRLSPLLDIRAQGILAARIMNMKCSELTSPVFREKLQQLHTHRDTACAAFPPLPTRWRSLPTALF